MATLPLAEPVTAGVTEADGVSSCVSAAAPRRVRRARVLLITNIFPPHIGGPATFIDRLARELSALGYRVTVVCSSDRPRDQGDVDRRFSVWRICTANKYWYQVKVRAVLLLELLRHRHVLVNGLEPFVSEVSALARRSYVLKIVGDTVWETARSAGRTTLDIDAFQRDTSSQREFAAEIEVRNSYVRRARLVLTPSDYLRNLVISWGVPAHRVITVQNGVQSGDSAQVPNSRTSRTLELLFVGRLTNWKGVETILLALTRLSSDVHLTVIGDGQAAPALVDLVRQLHLDDRVLFRGRQPAEVVRREMANAHVLVLPSLYEGLSHTLIEAAAAGLPAIASGCGGNPEVVVDGQNGLLVPSHDVEALACAIGRLQADEPLRMQLARGALQTARDFSLTRTIRGILAAVLASPE